MSSKRFLAILLSATIFFISVTGATFTYAASTTVEDGVAVVEDSSASLKRYIYYPEELKNNTIKYPVIIWANGTGSKLSLYVDLLKGLVRQGYIIVASDETMAADGKDQIENLDYVIKKSKSSSNILYNRIKTDKITAMGHSQGGRSAVNAAAADNRFVCVVSIAGSNYTEEAELLKAPALFFTGTSDSVVSSDKWVKPAYDICKGAAVYASLKGARHTTCCSEPDKYINYCVSWIKAWTDNDNAELSVFKSNGALKNDDAWTDVASKNLTNNIAGKISLSSTKYVYNGNAKKPSVTVKDYKGATISSNNYTVSYDKGRKNVGRYKVTIKYRNNYSGSKSLYFTIVPKASSISKLTAVKKGFTVKWKKLTTQTTGYQLQYSTSSKFKNASTKTIKNNKTTSKKITKLKAGKKYYVRIRTYKTVGGKKYYSSWGKTKTITTKK